MSFVGALLSFSESPMWVTPRTQRTVSFDDLPPSGSGQCALNRCHAVGFQGEVVPVVLPGSDGERARPRAGVHPGRLHRNQ